MRTLPRTAPARRMTYAFRKRMLRQALILFGSLVAVLLILVGTVDHKAFLIAAMVLIPAAALAFNLLTRRAYAASHSDSSR